VAIIAFPSIVDASAFDPESIRIMSDAFEDAWQSLQVTGTGVHNAEKDDERRAILAKRIIELAKTGERDRQTLQDAALAYLAELIVRKAHAQGSNP
jgi:hypothetical protein